MKLTMKQSAGVAAILVGAIALSAFMPDNAARLLVPAIGGGITLAFVLSWPSLMARQKGQRIDEALPLFITHFGVLATTNLPRDEILRILKSNPENPELAGEIARLYRLSTQWNLPFPQALRSVAEDTPSDVFGEFLRRLAHAVESGQSLDRFLSAEQEVIMNQYASIYEAALLKVDSWKEMYMNTVMSIAFMAVFSGMMPMLGGGDLVRLSAGVVGIGLFLEVMLGLSLQDRLPIDRLRPKRKVDTPEENRVQQAVLLGGAGSVLAFLGTLVAGFPLAYAMLATATPLLWPGIVAMRQEKRVIAREDAFPAFIRSLGSAAAARGGSLVDVLEHVRQHDLGALDQPVSDLHTRLHWRLDDEKSWNRFGEDTGSHLIDAFTSMFVQGIRTGGRAGEISQIISDNMVRILGLRTSRRATAGAFRGMLVGLTLGLSAVVFVGQSIFQSLLSLFGDAADVVEEHQILDLGSPGDAPTARMLLLILVFFHAVAAGFYFKRVEGGRMASSAVLMSIQIWLAVLASIAVDRFVPDLLGGS